MQYLASVIHDQASLASPEEHAAIDVFNDRLRAKGHWVYGGGLASPGTATIIDNRGGEALVTDGPFLESKEYLAGFWIIEAPTSSKTAACFGRSSSGWFLRPWCSCRESSRPVGTC